MEGDSWCPRSPAVCRDGAGLLSACCALLGAGVVPAANMGGELQHGWMDTLRVLWGGVLGALLLPAQAEIWAEWQSRGGELPQHVGHVCRAG